MTAADFERTPHPLSPPPQPWHTPRVTAPVGLMVIAPAGDNPVNDALYVSDNAAMYGGLWA